MGGRMTSLMASSGDLVKPLHGIVFLGFPLHAAGRPSVERADHLHNVDVPMLFLQGTRDKLAERARMRAVCRELGPRARLHEVEGADHGFHVLVRSGRNDAEVRFELGEVVGRFVEEHSA